MTIGKDGRPFEMARYIGWVKKGHSAIEVKPWKPGKVRKGGLKWTCPKCLGRFNGRAIAKHRDECK